MTRPPGRLLPDYLVRAGITGGIWGFAAIGYGAVLLGNWGSAALAASTVTALLVTRNAFDREQAHNAEVERQHADDT